MDFLEKDLEEILKTTPTEDLWEAGLDFVYCNNIFFTQVKIGNYGIADMLAYSRFRSDIIITVVELKKDRIGISAFLQALRYVRGIQSFFEKRGYKKDGQFLHKSFYRVKINIALIGRKLDTEGAFCYLPDLIHFDEIQFYTYNYGFNGITFKKDRGYKLTDEGF